MMPQKLRASTRNSKAARQSIANLNNLTRTVKKGALDAICDKVEAVSAANDGRLPHQYMVKLVAELQSDAATSWMTGDMIKSLRHRRRLLMKTRRKQMEPMESAAAGLLAVSEKKQDPVVAPPPQEIATPAPRKKGGRPKVLTAEEIQENKQKQGRVTSIAATEYAKKFEHYHKLGKYCPQGTLAKTIEDAKQEVGVADEVAINENTIRTRIKRQRLEPLVPRGGLVTPMISVEPLLVMICAKLASAGRPIGLAEFVELVNGLIKGTEVETQTIAFKAKHCGGDPKATSANIGKKYYQGFLSRNGHLLQSKQGEPFATDKSKWSAYTKNFERMYSHTTHMKDLLIDLF